MDALRYEYYEAQEKNGRLELYTVTTHPTVWEKDLHNLEATGTVLVDSDRHAFIYVLDNGDTFVHCSLNEKVWPFLQRALDAKMPVAVKIGGKFYILEHLHEELHFLIENIEDNPNYGRSFTDKVAQYFLQK